MFATLAVDISVLGAEAPIVIGERYVCTVGLTAEDEIPKI